jgi:hypothetical protein
VAVYIMHKCAENISVAEGKISYFWAGIKVKTHM